jgi:hypothetical protein
MLLLVLISFSLIGPAVFADSESRLPECCRRLGLHHCTGKPEADGRPSSGPLFQHVTTKCPEFPAGPVVAPDGSAPFLTVVPGLVASPAGHILRAYQSDTPLRDLFLLCNQKRAPPALTF